MRWANIARLRRRKTKAPPRAPRVRRPPIGTALDPAAPPQRTESCNGATAPQSRASGSTPSLPPPPPPARGCAPPRRGRCGPRLSPTPGGKRVSRSPRRRRSSADRTTGRPSPVGVTAPADEDRGRRRRASRAGRKTVAHCLSASSCAAGASSRPAGDLAAVVQRRPAQKRTPRATLTRHMPAIGSAAGHESVSAPVGLSGGVPGGGLRLRRRPPSPATTRNASSTPGSCRHRCNRHARWERHRGPAVPAIP